MEVSEKSIAIILIILGIAGLLFLYFVKPAEDSVYPKCPTRYFTGLNCPGCGTLRAVHSLLHLELKAALKFNFLLVLLLPVLLYGLAAYLAEALFFRKFPDIFNNKIFLWLMGSLVVVFCILRNIPVYPFSLLRS